MMSLTKSVKMALLTNLPCEQICPNISVRKLLQQFTYAEPHTHT